MAKDYSGRKYEVHSYNSAWPGQFIAESDNLRKVFGSSALKIEHIGSTAVPGLSAKPTIDILIVVENMDIAQSRTEQMKSIGYKDLGEYVMPGSRLYVKEREDGGDRLFNVHIFPKDHKHVTEMLDVRDYFRSHPEAVDEYNKLKADLVSKYPDDYGSYRKYKDQWMKNLVSRMS